MKGSFYHFHISNQVVHRRFLLYNAIQGSIDKSHNDIEGCLVEAANKLGYSTDALKPGMNFASVRCENISMEKQRKEHGLSTENHLYAG